MKSSNIQQQLLDQLSTAVVLLDQAGRFVYLNQAAEKAFLTTNKTLIGQRYSYFIEEDALPLRQLLSELKANGHFKQDKVIFSLKNGITLSANIQAQWVELEQRYLMIEWQDRAHQQKQQQDIDIQQQNQVSNRLLQQLAHEIKNPLSGVRGAAQLLAMEVSASQQEYTQLIEHEVNRLNQLVDRMLLRSETASKVPTNIHEITEQVYKFCQLKLPHQVELVRDYDPSLPELMIAPDSVYQALLNLVQNAIDACSEQPQARITLRTRSLVRYSIGEKQYPLCLLVEVLDDGPGVPTELQDSIFLPLISGKRSTGLGLGIAQHLIQQQDGLIEFSSKPNHTSFKILLPVFSNTQPTGDQNND
ncbi:MAG: PAS domain-containing protein [Kangiellaceae bacterium]|nr:PAS domain-containing protein [Kangiellaceae bacterium]